MARLPLGGLARKLKVSSIACMENGQLGHLDDGHMIDYVYMRKGMDQSNTAFLL